MKDDSAYCIEYLLKTSNYNALEAYVTKLNDEGIKFRETLSNSINSIEKELNEIYNKYKYKKEEYQKVIPAVQWAQNMSDIFLEIKFFAVTVIQELNFISTLNSLFSIGKYVSLDSILK